MAPRLGISCSIQLSYGNLLTSLMFLNRPTRLGQGKSGFFITAQSRTVRLAAECQTSGRERMLFRRKKARQEWKGGPANVLRWVRVAYGASIVATGYSVYAYPVIDTVGLLAASCAAGVGAAFHLLAAKKASVRPLAENGTEPEDCAVRAETLKAVAFGLAATVFAAQAGWVSTYAPLQFSAAASAAVKKSQYETFFNETYPVDRIQPSTGAGWSVDVHEIASGIDLVAEFSSSRVCRIMAEEAIAAAPEHIVEFKTPVLSAAPTADGIEKVCSSEGPVTMTYMWRTGQ